MPDAPDAPDAPNAIPAPDRSDSGRHGQNPSSSACDPAAAQQTRATRRRCLGLLSLLTPGLRALARVGAAGAAGVGGLARAAGPDPATLPEAKRTRAGLYLWAADVPAFIDAHGGAAKVLFLDLRTRAEAMYVGMARSVDALVPFVEHQELMTDWDDKRGMYKLEPLQDFVPEVARRLQQKGLGKGDVLVLICRSGDRSSRGADRLAQEGYTQVWSVADGFEGDMGKDGRRSVNGWKNAGLPWDYKLDKSKMYFPR